MKIKSLFAKPAETAFTVNSRVRLSDLGIVQMYGKDTKRYIWAGITMPCTIGWRQSVKASEIAA